LQRVTAEWMAADFEQWEYARLNKQSNEEPR
jgi:hypothetical protein